MVKSGSAKGASAAASPASGSAGDASGSPAAVGAVVLGGEE